MTGQHLHVQPATTISAEGGLRLTAPVDDDRPDIVAACRDPETQRYTRVPSPYGDADAVGFIHACRAGAEAGSSLGLVVRDTSGRLLGSCGLVDIDWLDGRASLGYWVAPWARGQGVATRAARAVCRWAFSDAHLERVELEAIASNAASNAVAARLGFILEGTLRAAARGRGTDAPSRLDVNVWGLLPGDLRCATR
ncbi:MAG: GNAT family N-acetyltransferase [Cellulomonadaceae bacterium]|nr:GNAT family N-acetyltransferase [Cellulomonadaceae bacterium]